MILPPDDPRHGTYNGYNNHGCRCAPCTRAAADYVTARNHRTGRHRPMAEYRAELAARGLPAHGTETRYVRHGCRCDECRAGSAAARQARREKKKATA